MVKELLDRSEVSVAALLAAMADRIVRDFQPMKIVLFGSHARGDAGLESDVDLLVVLPEVANKRQAAIAIRRALVDFPVCKDIIVTTPEEIARRGDLVGTVLRPAYERGSYFMSEAERLVEGRRASKARRNDLVARFYNSLGSLTPLTQPAIFKAEGKPWLPKSKRSTTRSIRKKLIAPKRFSAPKRRPKRLSERLSWC
jgi:predicted nucleotidyltransferase